MKHKVNILSMLRYVNVCEIFFKREAQRDDSRST